jgi:hypothetical protein
MNFRLACSHLFFALLLSLFVTMNISAECTDEERARMIMEDDLSTEEIDKKCGSRTTFDEEKKPVEKRVVENKMGTVNIKSPLEKTELEIHVNGSMHSSTDASGEKSLELKPGSYRIQLKNEEKKSEIKDVSITAGAVSTLNFSNIERSAPKSKPKPKKQLPESEPGKFVHNGDPAFSIEYPEEWDNTKWDCGPGSVLGITSSTQYKLPAVCVFVASSTVDIEDYIDITSSGWGNAGYRLQLTDEESLALKNGTPAQYLGFNASGPSDLVVVYIVAVKSGKTVSIMTYTHPSIDPSTLSKVVKSLQFYE